MVKELNPIPDPYAPSRVLIADDDRATRSLLRLAMEEDGHEVLDAENGIEAIDLFKQERPDIVLLDAVMPEMDGFVCCETLRSLPGGDSIPILTITVLDDRESVDLAFAVGATDYVTKPIHWPVLLQRVRRLLAAHRATLALQQQIERERQLSEQLEAANRELQRLVSIDGLTQISNRRYFDEWLMQEWKRLARERQPLASILCDVDCFKNYNDTYGHQAGDECLKQVARVLDETVKRPADLAARYGGEEFVVCLPNTGVEGARAVAEEIRRGVRGLALPHESSTVDNRVTLSLGVTAQVPQPWLSASRLLTNADRALYQAKAQGRDRVVVYSATPSSSEDFRESNPLANS